MQFHPSKCQVVRVTNKPKPIQASYNIHGMTLEEVSSVKYLGLHVDKKLMKSKENFRIAVDAVNASVDQVYEAFKSPKKTINSDEVTDYIPFFDPEEHNNYPMFQVQDDNLLRRADLENLSDSTTTSHWTGIGTLIKVRYFYNPRQPAI